jgi:hypothetical protein
MRMGSARDYRLRVKVALRVWRCRGRRCEGRAFRAPDPLRPLHQSPAGFPRGGAEMEKAEVSPGPSSAQFAPLRMERASRPVICQATSDHALHVPQSRVGSTLPPHPREAAGGAGSGSSHRQRGTTVADRWPLSKLLQASVSLPCRQVRCRASPFTLGLAGDDLGV